MQQSKDKNFKQFQSTKIEKGDSISLSGFENGLYHFRLVSSSGETSNPIQVQVEHHSLQKALVFFILGLLMFVILIGSLWHGSLNHIGKQ